MTEIVFLTVEEVLALHADAIAFAGGAPELRSMDLLLGALAQPEAGIGGRIRSHSEWLRPTPTT